MLDFLISIGLLICSGAVAMFGIWFVLTILEWMIIKFFFEGDD